MNRRTYIYIQISGIITWLLTACKHEPIEAAPATSEKKKTASGHVYIKKLSLVQVIPEEAVANETMRVYWTAENIHTLSLLTKNLSSDWEIIADKMDPGIGAYEFQLPSKFAKDDTFSIKIIGGGLEAIRENISTRNTHVLSKTIEIIKTEPKKAIAEEKLKLFFKAENITTVLVELRNKDGNVLGSENVSAGDGFCELDLPSQFDLDDVLSVKVSADNIFALKEHIPTYNTMKIHTDDHPELKIINNIKKISIPKGDAWFCRVSSTEMKVFSDACTHLMCGIDYIKDDNIFRCSCHGSSFSADGQVLNGPASLPLKEYECYLVMVEEFKIIY